ncbi:MULTISPECIES: hypothetical protein [Moorena]|uniref:EF-hand domain-containing protein n=3 Tax=Moorena TaxID=1155738 RepID=F4XIF1_9CYAN|nr:MULTISPECIES: hypothetical protein [Moorena]NEQ13476.1 hypothetical protein [Moorena sp. SIO3E2]EGJ35684.1 hypothetical protein LYNGBM3L_01390 [Moorena producens 3L]NEP32587.1 hypothetical protein [Moorena sp. SIO3B2]NEP66648.1 hypothetical protein [Moorena sp. SIO3A5]NEQ05478.1 hypothetical protein [Moorena sp. SIO4E2]
MEDNKFFRFVWRFNAIVIMATGLLAIAVLAFAAIEIVKSTTRERQGINIVNVNDDSSSSQEWELGNLREVDGTTYLMVPLYSDQSYTQSYYSKSTRSTINYLFLDSETGKSKWIFANNDYLITSDSFISETNDRANNRVESKPVIAVLYHLIKQDTNGDGRLTNNDMLTIAFTHYNGNDYQEVVSGVDRFLGYKVLNANSLLILYQRDAIAYSAKVSLDNFALSNETELPKVGQP